MKKLLLFLAVLLFVASPYCIAAGDNGKDETELESSKRVNTWLQVILPAYVGLSIVPQVENLGQWGSGCYSDFCFGMEIAGLRFTSRGSNLEADLGVRFQLMNFSGPADSGSVMHAASFGIPVRGAVKFCRWGKVFAGLSGDVLVSGTAGKPGVPGRTDARDTLSRFRASVEGGVSWHGVGLWASYGLSPVFRKDFGDAHTVSFGIVIGI